jgi:FMN-dependent NADH-azoreductase
MSRVSRILHIESSARLGDDSYSRRFASALVARLRAAHSGAAVMLRDLAAEPLPHVDAAFVAAMFTPEAERTPAQHAAMALSEMLVAELEAADAVVIGAPMYNYSVPSALKAWIDHVVRARRTFRHTPEGPVGLLRDRLVHVVTASGGLYGEGPGAAVDFFAPYLRTVLGKVGLKDVRVLRVEGLALGPEAVAAALARAEAELVRAVTLPAAVELAEVPA